MLESRRLLTTDPHAAWVFDELQAAPTVRLDLGGHALAGNWYFKWRGSALATGLATPGPGGFAGVNGFHDYEYADGGDGQNGAAVVGVRVSADGAMPPDGNYEFRLPADGFSPARASDFFQSDPATDFFLNADFDHNRAVDFDDLLALVQHYDSGRDEDGNPLPDAPTTGEKSFANGDTNADGLVSFDDLLKLMQSYNKRIAPAPTYAGQVTLDSLPVDGTLSPIVVNWKGVDDQAAGVDEFGHAFPARAIAGYTVYRGATSYSFSTVVGSVVRNDALGVGAQADYSLQDNSAVDGQKYYYRIRPYFNVTRPDGTAGVEHLATTNSSSRVAAMRAPTNLTAHALTPTSLRLSWLDHSQREGEYRVFRVEAGGSMTQVATAPQNATTIDLTGLAAGTGYTFRVQAWNPNIDSAWAETRAGTGVSATSSRPLVGVRVGWAQQTPAPDGFVVFRKAAGQADFAYVSHVGPGVTSYQDASPALVVGQTYIYRVVPYAVYHGSADPAVGSLGEAAVVYGDRPALSYTSDTLTITWPAGQTPPESLEVRLRDQTTGLTTLRTVTLSPLGDSGTGTGSGDYVVADLTPGRTYDVDYADAGDPTDPGNASDGAVAVTMREWRDSVIITTGSGVTEGVTRTDTPRPPADNPYGVVQVAEGDTITVTFTNLPEHTFLQVGGDIHVDKHLGDPVTGELIANVPDRDAALAAVQLEAALDGQALGFTKSLGFGQDDYLWLGYGPASADGWVEHTSSTATLTFKTSGGIPGWYMRLLGNMSLNVGTPTVEVSQTVDLIEVDQPTGIARIRRSNGVATQHELNVTLMLDDSRPGSASGSDVSVPSEVVIEGSSTFADVTITALDDDEAEDVEPIHLAMALQFAPPTTAKAGTVDSNVLLQTITIKRIPYDEMITRFPVLENNSSYPPEFHNPGGYEFYVLIEFSGENLHKLQVNQFLQIETLGWNTLGTSMPEDVATSFAVDSLHPEMTNSGPEAVQDPGGAWQEGFRTVKTLNNTKNGKSLLLEHQSWKAKSFKDFENDDAWNLFTQENNFILKFKRLDGLGNVEEFKWGYQWTNDPAKRITENPRSVVASAKIAPKGKFKQKDRLTGLDGF